jgi:tRNA dimethylallyltransferase
MTVYKGMDIGTDKPITKIIPYHLMDIVAPDEDFNVTKFRELAAEKIKKVQDRGNLPLLVGGSTMYIDSVAYNYSFPSTEPDPSLRKEFDAKTDQELFDELITLDPDAEWTIDRHNRRRLIRALEVCRLSKKPFTTQKKKESYPKIFCIWQSSRIGTTYMTASINGSRR